MLLANKTRRSDNGRDQVLCKSPKVPFAFSFPLCDLLICEFAGIYSEPNAHRFDVQPLPPTLPAAVVPLWKVAHLIYQKVISRKPVPLQPDPDNNPNYMLVRTEETLECGHVRDFHFLEGVETLTARKRCCHECQGFNGGLILKKPNASILRSIEFHKKKKQAGFSPWFSIGWAVLCASLLVVALARGTRRTYTFSYPSNYLRVIRNVDPCLPDGSCGYRFVVQSVVNGVAQPETEMQFCTSLQPRFENGHTLSWIRYTNLGSCNAIDGYDVVHEGKFAKLAPNCKADYTLAPKAGHILCQGGRAEF